MEVVKSKKAALLSKSLAADNLENSLNSKVVAIAKTSTVEQSYQYPEGWKPPKTLALAADLFYETKQKRLAIKKEMDALQTNETALKNYLIDNLPKSNASGIAGKMARVTIVKKEIARAENWPKIYATIVADYNKHAKKKDGMQDGAFALLQRRLGESAVQEAWGAGKIVDGVGKFTIIDISVNKV